MPYIQRDRDNKIIGSFANPQSYAQELLADDDTELLAWVVSRHPTTRRKTELEALLELIVEKNIITKTEIDTKRQELVDTTIVP